MTLSIAWIGRGRLLGRTATFLGAAIAVSVALASRDVSAETSLDYLGRGASAYRAGDFSGAIRHWSEAARLCSLDGNAFGEAEALARRGETLRSMGFLGDAIRDLTTALQRAEQARSVPQIAAVTGALGNAYFHAHDLAAARPMLQRSLELARAQGLDDVLAASSNNFGNLLAASGERREAVDYYDAAAAAADRAGDAALAATALTNHARLAAEFGGPSLPLLERARSLLAGSGRSHDTVLALVAVSRLAQTLPPRSAQAEQMAYATLRDAAVLAEELGDGRAASLAYGNLGALYQERGRREEALTLTRRALFKAQQVAAPDLLYRWEWQAGRLHRDAGNVEQAIASYRRAVADLGAIRSDVPIEYRDGHSSFRETIGPLFYELADLLLRRARGSREDDLASLLTEARDTVEQLKAAELRDYFRDECVTAVQAKTKGIEDVSARTAALYPIVLGDRVELLLSLQGTKRQVTVPVSRERLTAEVHRLRALLEKRTTGEYLVPARQVYDWIIRPIAPELESRGIDTLVWVPDGALRTLPLAALHDGREFLIARFAIATAPGLTLIDPKPLVSAGSQAAPRVLVAGVSQGVQGFSPLPNAAREIAAIGAMEGGRIIENAAFRRADFEQQLRTTPYSIVHIASHGEFSGDPQTSFILTFDDKLTLDQLERSVKFSEFREDSLELLTLSACRTAAGDDRAALGLAGIAIKAGARSAMATLWLINDEAASNLVVDFYGRLRQPGMTKAKALQQAQLAMVQDRRFRHPFYWSAFLMLGNWL